MDDNKKRIDWKKMEWTTPAPLVPTPARLRRAAKRNKPKKK